MQEDVLYLLAFSSGLKGGLFEAHVYVEVVAFVISLQLGLPLLDLLPLELDLADVGLVPAHSVHRKAQNQQQNAQGHPNFMIDGFASAFC